MSRLATLARIVPLTLAGAGLLWAAPPSAMAHPPARDEVLIEIGLRLVAAEARAEAIASRLGERHPELIEARTRARFLSEQAAKLSPMPSSARGELVRRLRLDLGTLQRDRLELQARYREKHPQMVEIGRQIQVYERFVRRWGANPTTVHGRPTLAELIIKRARLKGLSRYLSERYGPRHPRMIATARELKSVRAALAGQQPLTAEQAAEVRALMLAWVKHLAAEAAHTTDAAKKSELEFVTDSLLAGAAQLPVTSSPKQK